MESCEDLHALIKKQIDEGRVISDRECGTPSDKIIAWIKVSRRCLIHMENRVPTLLRDFESLNFYFRMPEEDVLPKVLEVGDRVTLLQEPVEDRWSQSWFRDGRDHPIDFDFSALQHAVELLEWAVEKLQLDSAPEAVLDLSPKLRATKRSAGNTLKMASDESALSATALPSGPNARDGRFDGNEYEAGPEPLNWHDRVDTFLLQCTRETKLKAMRKHIWQAVGHRTARQFQFWQASSPKATASDDSNFSRILRMNPTEFEILLKNKGII
jgi:hypothetical protein